MAGAFSSDAARSKASGRDLYLAEDRCYGSYGEMLAAESRLPAEARIDFVSIVTPNFLHFPVAKAALEHGFHVMCDKPMTFNLAEARELEAIVKKSGLLFGLTHNYTGYPLVKEARERVRAGALGRVRKVVVEYPQGWLAARLEESGQKQADWRTDPKRAGISCCMGDIGTHAENLAEYVTGLRIKSLCADLTTFVPGRPLDDDGNVLLRLEGGAKGVLHASQISVGEENALSLRVYGEKGGLIWRQERAQYPGPDLARPAARAGPHRRRPAERARRLQHPPPRRPSRGLPGGLRQSLPPLRRHPPGPAGGREAGRVRNRFPHRGRRRPRHGLHRGGGGQLAKQGKMAFRPALAQDGPRPRRP